MNQPLRESNRGLFGSAGIRNRQDVIQREDGEVVANVVWEAFLNRPKSVLAAVFRKGGVLLGKGGFHEEKIKSYGHIFAKVSRERNSR